MGIVMKWLDVAFTRRRSSPNYDEVSPVTKPRLLRACSELTTSEKEVQHMLGLTVRPRLALIDEETAAIVTPTGREALEDGSLGSVKPPRPADGS